MVTHSLGYSFKWLQNGKKEGPVNDSTTLTQKSNKEILKQSYHLEEEGIQSKYEHMLAQKKAIHDKYIQDLIDKHRQSVTEFEEKQLADKRLMYRPSTRIRQLQDKIQIYTKYVYAY